jgi:hypothetical protein
MNTTTAALYQSSQRIINSRINATAYRWHEQVDRSELESAAHEIFLNAVKTWAPDRSLFSTHLYTQLGRLTDTARREAGRHYRETPECCTPLGSLDALPQSPTPEQPDTQDDPPDLSPDALLVLRMILTGSLDPDLDAGRKSRPNLSRAITRMKPAGWLPSRTTAAWTEITDWYRAGGCVADVEVAP